MDKIPVRIRIAFLLLLVILGSLGLGFSLAAIFARGPGLAASLGVRLVPLFLAFFLSSSFFVVLSLPAKTPYRPFTLFALRDDYVPADHRLGDGDEIPLQFVS